MVRRSKHQRVDGGLRELPLAERAQLPQPAHRRQPGLVEGAALGEQAAQRRTALGARPPVTDRAAGGQRLRAYRKNVLGTVGESGP